MVYKLSEYRLWISSRRMTFGVLVRDGIIQSKDCPPIIKIFIGQPIGNLIKWMRPDKIERIEEEANACEVSSKTHS